MCVFRGVRDPNVEWMWNGWSPGANLIWLVPGIGGLKNCIWAFEWANCFGLGRNSLFLSIILFAASFSVFVRLLWDSVLVIFASRMFNSSC